MRPHPLVDLHAQRTLEPRDDVTDARLGLLVNGLGNLRGLCHCLHNVR